jgi:centromere protein I
VQRIVNAAFTSGIPTDDLTSLVDILTQPNHIEQSSVTTLIKNLYPSSKVSSTIIVKIVCALGPGKTKPSHATQGLLLQWILLVYEVLGDHSCLHRLYRTLFNQLDMLSLRRPLCQLLCMITRRKHVKPYRIQTLLELQQKYGDEAALGSLIRVYKDYYPDIIVTEIRGKRWAQLAPQDHGWIERLRMIQAATMAQESSRSDFQSQSSFKVVRRGAKRSRASVIPEVQTYGTKEGATVLEEIENVEDFVSTLEKIELPNQLISVVQDPLAMKMLKLRPDQVAELRLEQWLEAFFRDISRDADAGEETSSALEFVLEELRIYVRYTKVGDSSL